MPYSYWCSQIEQSVYVRHFRNEGLLTKCNKWLSVFNLHPSNISYIMIIGAAQEASCIELPHSKHFLCLVVTNVLITKEYICFVH